MTKYRITQELKDNMYHIQTWDGSNWNHVAKTWKHDLVVVRQILKRLIETNFKVVEGELVIEEGEI